MKLLSITTLKAILRIDQKVKGKVLRYLLLMTLKPDR